MERIKFNYGSNCRNKDECIFDLKQSYVEPGHPIAYSGIENIYYYYKKLIPKNEIEAILNSFDTYSRHKEFHIGQRNPSYSHFKRYQFQCDLVDIQALAKYNDGVRYLFTCIDTFTRYAFVRLLRSKEANTVLDAFNSILEEAVEPPINLVMDRGTEFYNKNFELFCDSIGIKYFSPDSSIHGAFIERFNRTLQDIIYKFMSEYETYRFIDITINGNFIKLMPLFLKTYNNRRHRMTGFTPYQAETDIKTHYYIRVNQAKYHRSIKKRKVKYQIGDTVRISKSKGKFTRGYKDRAQEEFFRIHDIKTNMNIPMYILSNFKGDEIIKGAFYAFELTPIITNEIYKVEKVIKRRIQNGQKQIYVKWVGFDDSHNSWINESQIVQTF